MFQSAANPPEIATRIGRASLLDQMYRAVEGSYPEEGCGFVFEKAGGELEVVVTTNRATLLHKKDPERYPRDGRNYFEPDMKPWLRAVREGLTPRIIFHSHPEVGAYFSKTDRASAVIEDPETGTVFERNPGVDHLVISVRGSDDPRADRAVMFRFDDETTDFIEVAAFNADGQVENGN